MYGRVKIGTIVYYEDSDHKIWAGTVMDITTHQVSIQWEAYMRPYSYSDTNRDFWSRVIITCA